MKNKMLLKIPQLILIGISFIITASCNNEDSKLEIKGEIPLLTVVTVRDITDTSAIASSSVYFDGGADIVERGFCWSLKDNPLPSGNKLTVGSSVGSFSGLISGLSDSTKYFIRAYAINTNGITGLSSITSFTTSKKIIIDP